MVHDYSIRVNRMENKLMSIAQMITLALVVFAFWLGNRSGYANGYVNGRKAVRYYYENLEKARENHGRK